MQRGRTGNRFGRKKIKQSTGVNSLERVFKNRLDKQLSQMM